MNSNTGKAGYRSLSRDRNLHCVRQLALGVAAFGLVALIARPANANTGAQSQTVSACFPPDCNALADLDWGVWSPTTISIPKFDPLLGTLNSVELSLDARYVNSLCIENDGPVCVPLSSSTTFATTFTPTQANTPAISGFTGFSLNASEMNVPLGFFLGPSNGISDCQLPFAPPSDGTCSGGDFVNAGQDFIRSTGVVTLTTHLDVSAWVAGTGPGVVEISGIATGITSVAGGASMTSSFEHKSRATIAVTYNYTPAETGNRYCFGDGTQGVCPCGATGTAGQGCPNTNGNGRGAGLRAAGSASAAADTFCLTIEDAPSNKPGIVFQGAMAQNYPNGLGTLANASGLLCVVPALRGNVIFLDATGAAVASDFLGQPFSATAQAPGSTTYYQFWFRDTGNPCQNAPANSAASNFSNAVEVDWMP